MLIGWWVSLFVLESLLRVDDSCGVVSQSTIANKSSRNPPMNNTETKSSLSSFRIVADDIKTTPCNRAGFYIHAYDSGSRQIVEVSTHWSRQEAEFALATLLIGRDVLAISGVRPELFKFVGKVVEVSEKETVCEFGGKFYSCPTPWFSQTFQSVCA